MEGRAPLLSGCLRSRIVCQRHVLLQTDQAIATAHQRVRRRIASLLLEEGTDVIDWRRYAAIKYVDAERVRGAPSAFQETLVAAQRKGARKR
jgi:hypothetical protein